MFMKKYSFQSTVINFNEDEDEGDWQSVMAKCLGARHLAMLPQIPDITMSDAGEPSGIFSSMEDPEIGRDMGSISHAYTSPILPKTIIERIPDSPPATSPAQEPQPSAHSSSRSLRSFVSSPFASPAQEPLTLQPQLSARSSSRSLRSSLVPSPFSSPAPEPRASPQPTPETSHRVSRSKKSVSPSSSIPSLSPDPRASLQPTPKTSHRASRSKKSSSPSSSIPSLSPEPRASLQPTPKTSYRASRSKKSVSPVSSPFPSLSPEPPASPQPASKTSHRASRSMRSVSPASSTSSLSPEPRASPQPTLNQPSHRASRSRSVSPVSSIPPASPKPRASPRQSSFPHPSPANKRPKRFLKGKRCEKWRGQHPIYKPLENGCFEVLGLTHAKTPDIMKRKLTKVNKVKKETKKTNSCNLSESFVGRSVSTRSKNASLIKSFENLQWKKTKGSDSVELATLFRDKNNGLASGFFRMNGACEKPSQKTANYKTIYTLLKGSVAFKIADDPFMVLNEFESVTIPEITGYAIKNISDDESILYFNVYQH